MTDLLLEMLSRYGLTEVNGPQSHPDIIKMGQELGIEIEDDSTFSWCSILLCYYAKKLSYEQPNSPAARSWLKMPLVVLKPTLGDVVVLWRESPSSWKGHVGLFINWDKDFVWLLGGNQNNQINISKFTRSRILGIRQMHKINDTD
jgi:uncharacterized protein (TIGR02594 family)